MGKTDASTKPPSPSWCHGATALRSLLTLVALAALALVMTAAPAAAAPTQFRVSGDLHVSADQTLDSVVTMNGDITVEGVVLSSAFTANGNIRVLPGGRIDGDAVSLTGSVVVDEGGSIGGETVEFGGGGVRVNGAGSQAVAHNVGVDTGSGAGWFFFVVGAMGLGLLLVLIAGGSLESVGHELSARTGRSALVGLLSLIGLPVLFVILLISVVGIPVALLLIPLVPLVAMFGIYAIALLAGRRLLETTGRGNAGDVWAMLAGVALLGVASLIPVLGVLLWVAGGFFGLGAVLTRLWEHYQDRRAVRAAGRQATQPPPYAGGPEGPVYVADGAGAPGTPAHGASAAKTVEATADTTPVVAAVETTPAVAPEAASPQHEGGAAPADEGPRFHI